MADARTLEDVRDIILSAHKSTGLKEKVSFYNTWAESYEQVTNTQHDTHFKDAYCYGCSSF